jgi:predicted nucleic acid-binding protein
VIFLDTNVVSELMRKSPDPGVVGWLERHDVELALSTIVIGEIAFGIEKIAPAERAHRLTRDFDALRRRYADRIFGFTEAAALVKGALAGERSRAGRPMPIADAMIAAIARSHGAQLATRNLSDFAGSGLELISPWSA